MPQPHHQTTDDDDDDDDDEFSFIPNYGNVTHKSRQKTYREFLI